MSKERTLTHEEIEEMRVFYRQAMNKGEQVKILQDRFLVSESTVVRVLGLKVSPVRHGHARVDPFCLTAALKDIRENGLSVSKAAQKYGTTYTTLKKYLKGEVVR